MNDFDGLKELAEKGTLQCFICIVSIQTRDRDAPSRFNRRSDGRNDILPRDIGDTETEDSNDTRFLSSYTGD